MANLESDAAFGHDDLERELQQALSVDPSPEFLARVRARIAGQSMRATWSRNWVWISCAITAACLAIALWVPRSKSLGLPPLRELPRTDAAAPVALPPPLKVPERNRREAAAARIRPRPAKTVRPSGSDSEVLIAKDEAAALKRLMRGLRRGEVDRSTLTRIGTLPTGPPPEIVVWPIPKITPIAIEPLGLEGGARQ